MHNNIILEKVKKIAKFYNGKLMEIEPCSHLLAIYFKFDSENKALDFKNKVFAERIANIFKIITVTDMIVYINN